jgi:deoxyribose-phosphate aldolase
MTSRYTDPEWQTFIDEIDREIKLSVKPYADSFDIEPSHIVGAIDHTLLKLDAKSAQIDDLCAEARVNGFAVSFLPPDPKVTALLTCPSSQ